MEVEQQTMIIEPPKEVKSEGATHHKQNQAEIEADLLNRRIECKGIIGKVRYVGPLLHEIPEGHVEVADKDKIWLGIEWDTPQPDSNNGTVRGHTYFETFGNQSNATFTLASQLNLNLGRNIFDALSLRYYKNPVQVTLPTKMEETPPIKEEVKSHILIEYDEDAYVQTIKNMKKQIAFLGFDKIWEKISNLKEIKEVSVPRSEVSDVGSEDGLSCIIPSAETLSIEENLIYDWNQIFLIGHELKNLQTLSISRNYLNKPPANINLLESIFVNSKNAPLNVRPAGIFRNLKTLVLVDMRLTWAEVSAVLPMSPIIEELVLCRNKCNDHANIRFDPENLKRLKLLNVEDNQISNFEVLAPFSILPSLARLVLSKNEFRNFGGLVKGFPAVSNISIEENHFEDCMILHELSLFPSLTQLRIGKNPFCDKLGKNYVRQRAIAEIKTLKSINGSDFKQIDRKDAEIFYLRKSFEEYFQLTGKPHYDYDFDDFMKFAIANHPRIEELIKVYGNPFPRENKIAPPQAGKIMKIAFAAGSGPFLGKDPMVKKMPDNTLIINLKSILAKMFQLDQAKVVLKMKPTPTDPFITMDEDLKNLFYYGVKELSEIWAEEQ